MKKLLLTLTLIASFGLFATTAFASTAAPWNIKNITDTFISPTLVNGTAEGILVSASSTINGNFSVSGLTSGNCVQASTGGLLTSASGACGSSGSSFSYLFPGNATSTTLAFLNGLIDNASTTFPYLGTGGLAVNNGQLYNAATTTFSSGLTYVNGNVTNTGVTSIVAGTNVTISGATGAVTINASGSGTVTAVNGTTNQITSSGGTTPTLSIPSQFNIQQASTTLISVLNGVYIGTTATTTLIATATSTFATGLNLTTGCLTYNGGACLGSAGTFNGGTSLAVQFATIAALPANTYAGGILTEVGTGALTVDGTSVAVGNRILVKNEVAQTNNGIYSVTAAGSGIAAYVLTRVSDYNSSANVYPGEATYVVGGATLADDWWALTTVAPITVGGGGAGSNLTYVETNAASSLTGSTGQNAYFSSSGVVTGTSTIFITTASHIGFGTSTPSATYQFFSTGTTTTSLDSNSATQGSCIEMKDYKGGGYTYLHTYQGSLIASTISCK